MNNVGYNLAAPTYAEAQTVVNDTIMEQQSMTYNQIGTVLSTTAKQRYHDAVASQLGALGDPSTAPKARVTYSASWIDGVGRTFASADYGTNGGTAFTRPATVPTRSDTILVSTTSYNDDGEVFSTLDPQNTETRFEYNAAGDQVTQIDNYVSGGTAADQNRTTWTTYTADGQVKTLTASNADTGNQQTKYDYGTTLSNSNIASSQLLRFVTYPDALGTGSDFVTYSYNRQGQQTLVIDQRGCQHAYDYDGLGRQIHDRVLSLGSSAVGMARRLSTIYNTRGMVDRVTTWDNPLVGFGTVLNQVQSLYNDFGQQTDSYQEHGGSVNISTTPKVQYSYADGSSGNTIRNTGMTFPNGRTLAYEYGSDIDHAASRIQQIKFSGEVYTLASYQYLGASAFVDAGSPEPGITWTLIGTGIDPDTGDIYWGLDRFGRVDNCLWKKSTTTLAQIQYGYDRASNRKWRDDGVLTGYDELYSYDGLYRLTDQKRGTLTGTTITTGTFEQQWGLDATGNWKTFKQDNDGNGTWELNQTRTANKVNEISGITNSVGTAWATPTYDGAGNMIGMPNPPATTTGATPAWVPLTEAQWNTLTEAQWNTFTENTGTTAQALSARYDAWNRLVLITNGTQKVIENAYDARGYRIRKDTYTSGTLTEARHYYYTPGWQCVEERVDASTTAERQFVWGLRYIDDLILRDRSTANNGTINERRYAMQDGNWNTIAICDITGSVTERYAYSAYGTPVFMTGAGVVQSSSPIGFETLYAGYRWDGTAPQMYYVRNRFLLPMIGTWNRRDPLGYVDGMGLYQLKWVIIGVDPFGFAAVCVSTYASTSLRVEIIDGVQNFSISCITSCQCTGKNRWKSGVFASIQQRPINSGGPDFTPKTDGKNVTELPVRWRGFEEGFCRNQATEKQRQLNLDNWCDDDDDDDDDDDNRRGPWTPKPIIPPRCFDDELTRQRLRKRDRNRPKVRPRKPGFRPKSPNPVTDPIVAPSVDIDPLLVGAGIAIIVATLAEDIFTCGGGIADDPLTIGPGAGMIWKGCGF